MPKTAVSFGGEAIDVFFNRFLLRADGQVGREEGAADLKETSLACNNIKTLSGGWKHPLFIFYRVCENQAIIIKVKVLVDRYGRNFASTKNPSVSLYKTTYNVFLMLN